MNLKYQLVELFVKDNEIKNLKLKLIPNNNIPQKKFNMDDIMIVYFQSFDKEMDNVSIKCLLSDTFAEVEEKLYKKYENFRNKNNIAICNGKTILRFKKLSENNIKDGDIILLCKIE